MGRIQRSIVHRWLSNSRCAMIPTSTLDLGILMSSLGMVRGGLETVAAQFARALSERGHRVTVVAGRWPPHALPAATDLPLRWLRAPCVPAQLAAWRRLARRRPAWPLKIQSLSFAYACRLHPAVRELIARADVTLTFFEIETVLFSRWRQQHGQPHVSYFPGVIDWRWLQRDRSVVRVAISQAIARRCQGVPGLAIDGVVVPGVPDHWLDGPYVVRPEARILIFVGRLEANKGVLELLAIFEALAAEFPDLRLRIVGDGPLRQALVARLERAGLADRATFLGAVPAERVQQELRAADLFVFPSHYESFGIAILEALAVGLPVVSSDLPATREAAGDAGRLLPAGSTALWVEAIRALIGDLPARQQMSLAGRAHARAYTWRRAAEAMESYLDLARSRRA
jgi:glycosyltransferase involved in cell wall biosynthesis